MGCEREKAGGFFFFSRAQEKKTHARGGWGGAESGRRVAGEQLDARAAIFTHATRLYLCARCTFYRVLKYNVARAPARARPAYLVP
jgi:hypothetical protein